ncbi:hypothetical protein PG985_013906 [Apiospora marii]|uniref:uncharacterized protein n=1 Tax=Apiospora marii TaxID=335849 RepID=UPI0031315948
MASTNRPKVEMYSFAGYLSRMSRLDNFPEITSPTRVRSRPVELLSFDELLSRDTAAAVTNDLPVPQGNNKTARLPVSCRWCLPPPQIGNMAHWRSDAHDGFPANPDLLWHKDCPESKVRGTAMPVGDMSNTNLNIADIKSHARPAATEKDIVAFLDGLEDVEPNSDKDMGGNLVYGKRYLAARSASTSIKTEDDFSVNDTDSDVDMDKEETIDDVIMVSSGKSAQAPGQNGPVHAKDATAGTSSGDTTVVLSSSPEPQPEDQQGRRGNNGRRGRAAAPPPSSENEYLPSHSSGEETEEVREDDHQSEDESPAPTNAKKQPPKQKEVKKYYYFATGLYMSKEKMEKAFPDAIYVCRAKLKGYRWLRCGPRRYDLNYLATGYDPFPGDQDPEGYATIAPVYTNRVYDRTNTIVQQSNELDLEGSCVYGSLYEVSVKVSGGIMAETMKWKYRPTMVTVFPLEKDRGSMEPELAGSMPLILREIPGDDGTLTTVLACTYLVDGTGWHLPWRQPDINCGGHMEVGRLRDHERPAMLPYMRAYNQDIPPSNTPYPLPQFALERRHEIPRPLSNDYLPQVDPDPYLKELRDVFYDMLFDHETPLWYVNEVLRPWVKDLPDWPHAHGKRNMMKKEEEDDENIYD